MKTRVSFKYFVNDCSFCNCTKNKTGFIEESRVKKDKRKSILLWCKNFTWLPETWRTQQICRGTFLRYIRDLSHRDFEIVRFSLVLLSSIDIEVIRTILFFLLKYFAQKKTHKLYSNILKQLKKHNKQQKQLSSRCKTMNFLI